MADLENSLNTLENSSPETTSSPNESELNLNLSNPSLQEETQETQQTNVSQDLASIKIEEPMSNFAENNQPAYDLSTDSKISEQTEWQGEIIQQTTPNIFAEDTIKVQSFDNTMSEVQDGALNLQPTINSELNITSDSVNIPTLDQQTMPENSLNLSQDSNPAQEQDKTKLAQKEKLVQLIKVHESKAQKTWFTKWILSGIVLILWILIVSFVFAKEQILNFLNGLDENNSSLSANVVDLSIKEEVNDEVVNDNENTINVDVLEGEDIINEENSLDDENMVEDENIMESENVVEDENITENENIIENEYVGENEFFVDFIENYFEKDNEQLNSNETISEESIENNKYTITHVNSEEEANWVLPAHCSDLTCYGEEQEFTPCNKFRLDDKLTEDSQRIRKNGSCKYNDSSELVYVEFNN